MFVSSWILKFYVQKKRICGTFAEQHKTTQAGTAFLPGYILFSGSPGWLMEVKCLETACFPLFPSFPNIMRNCEFLHSPTWTGFFFFFLVSVKVTCMNPPHTWLMNPTTAKERDRQGEEGLCQYQLRFARSNSQSWTRKGMMKLRTEGCINTHALILLLKLFAI